MTGLHLSQYRIDAELGRGGMGIVYKATDTKLNRTVALKVLPAAALSSEDDRARFVREAQSAAQLHHPNIATVFGIDEAVPVEEGKEPQPGTETRLFIAMEYIEGETVRQVVEKGPLKLQDAVNIAGQVAEALKEAHAKQIVHRDIKSANVMLTTQGVAKVLDFGLAKTNQSTMLTRMGSTLGTVAYMSPEQARGHEVDGRTDLYSLGTMLYEMVAGKLPFAGDYEQAVLYGIMNEPAEPLTAMRTGVPMELERIVAKLLSKEAEYRYQTAGDLLADLKSLSLGGSGVSRRSMPATSIAEMPVARAQKLPKWVWAAIIAVGVIAVGAGWLARTPAERRETDHPVVRTEIDVTDAPSPPIGLAISNDGSRLAYTDFEVVRVRNLQSGETWEIPNSEAVFRLEFSGDDTWLLLNGFGRVQRVPIRGGRPVNVVSKSTQDMYATWGPDETVIYHDRGSLYRIPIGGGDAEQVLVPDSAAGETALRAPFVTADGSTLIVKIETSDSQDRIAAYDYPEMRRRGIVDPGGDAPVYLESGHLVYNVSGELMGRPFDLASATSLGPPAPLASEITPRAWSVSRAGLMASAFQVVFSASQGNGQGYRLVRQLWNGEPEILSVQAATYDDMDLSSDGRSLIVEILGGDDGDLWSIDITTGVRNQLTFDGGGDDPVWMKGTDSVLYVHRTPARSRIVVQSGDGSGESRELLAADDVRFADPDWSPDGSTIAYVRLGQDTDDDDIWLLDTATGESRPGIGGEADQREPRFSPDGRFLMYESSDQGGESRIFVQPASLTGGRWDVSRGLGYDPRWSADGSAIYYRQLQHLMRVAVDTRDRFEILSNPEPVLSQEARLRDWSLLPDATGIVSVLVETGSRGPAVTADVPVDLVFNWFEEVEEIAPHPDR